MSGGAEIPKTRTWLAVVALIVAAGLWSLNGPLIKLLDKVEVDGWTIACYRSLLGGIVFLPFAWGRIQTLKRVTVAWPIATVIMFTTMTASFVIANTMTEAANVIILQYTSPIWVFLLAPLLLGEKPGKTEGLVLIVAMVGVGIILSGNPRTNLAGLGVALLSGLGYGSLTVGLRALRPVNPTVVAAMNALGSGLILLPAVALWGQFHVTTYGWTLLLVLALVQFTLPYVLFSWALQHIEAHRAALIVLLETILNPIWTFLFVGEVPPPATLIGGPFILAGVAAWLLLAWRRERVPRRLVPELGP